MEITSETRLCGLIGHPIIHSVSPQMHNAAFKFLKLSYIYLAFDVLDEKLGEAVRGLASLGARGFNVTIPHKVSVIRFLDYLDSSAEKAGAVNTVVIREGELVGYNTDVNGVREVLKRTGGIEGERALIIGAGGAARAVGVALIECGFRDILIANRTPERGRELAERLRELGANSGYIEFRKLESYIGETRLIVNTTPIGMWPNIDESPVREEKINEKMVVLDLVYNPAETRLLKEARLRGAVTLSGLEVLVEQGAAAFKLWTGVEAPREVMMKAAEEALKRWGT